MKRPGDSKERGSREKKGQDENALLEKASLLRDLNDVELTAARIDDSKALEDMHKEMIGAQSEVQVSESM